MTWTNNEIAAVLERLRRQGSDDGRYEAKSCAHDIGSSVWESVSAFANTQGGALLLGISESEKFKPVDGFDANKILSQFADGIGDGNPQGIKLTNPPRYEVTRCESAGKPFLAIDIQENAIGAKPCFITAKGPQSGGYRRMDDKDIHLSPTEIFEFVNALVPSSADRAIVAEADLTDLNETALDRLIDTFKDSKALRGARGRKAQLARLNITDKEGGIRLAGLLAAGQYPQQYYPKLLIDVTAHPDVVKSGAGMVRFLDRVLCDGNMPEAIEQAVEATAKNLRTPTLVSGAGAKTDTEIPREVLREVIANAVIHREYGDFFLGESVSVDIYPDRVEVSSPGGLWGGVTPDTIGNGESRCRNATLIQLLHQVPYDGEGAVTVEGQGSGIPLVVREMESRALPAPRFVARPDYFTVILDRYRAQYADSAYDIKGGGQSNEVLNATETAVLQALSLTQPRNVHEISAMTQKSLSVVRKALRSLIDADLAVATAPAASRHRKYLRLG
jgi:ATP-dependent DNA helicase RecG